MAGTTSRTQTTWVIATSVVAGFMLLLLGSLVLAVDATSKGREQTLVKNGLVGRIAELERSVVPQTTWDDAVKNLSNRFNYAWARDNIGSFLSQTAGFEIAYVLDTSDTPRYGMEVGKSVDPSQFLRFTGAAGPLISIVRKREMQRGPITAPTESGAMVAKPIQSSAISEVGDRIYILTASLVQPDFSADLPLSPKTAIVVTGEEIDEQFLSTLAERFMLENPHLQRGAAPALAGKASVALEDISGKSIASLSWPPQTPGRRMLREGIAPLLLILSCLAVGAYVLFRRNQKLTEALVQSARLAEQANAEKVRAADRAKTTFLANMSHELRTPLNVIMGYSELAKESAATDGRAQDASDSDRILLAARHLLQLVDNLLDLSKIEAGKMAPHLKPCDVGQLIHDVAHMMQPVADKNGSRVDVTLQGDLEYLETDDGMLRQCLFNLVSNACKFTNAGVITIAARYETEQGLLAVEVRDTGIGMTSDQLARLFRPYAQAESATRGAFGGTGLGLALTRELARLLGGDVSVTSSLGVGSTFTLEIHARTLDALTWVAPELGTCEQPEHGLGKQAHAA